MPCRRAMLIAWSRYTAVSSKQSPRAVRPRIRQPWGSTRDDITNMHKLRMQGRINDTDWLRWEHEMVAAGREGRILGGLPTAKSVRG